jgi:hypothetical protein
LAESPSYAPGPNPRAESAHPRRAGRVEMGEPIAITRNGIQAALLERKHPYPLSGLIESEKWRPAQGPLPWLAESEAAASESAGLEAILDDRYGKGWSSRSERILSA